MNFAPECYEVKVVPDEEGEVEVVVLILSGASGNTEAIVRMSRFLAVCVMEDIANALDYTVKGKDW